MNIEYKVIGGIFLLALLHLRVCDSVIEREECISMPYSCLHETVQSLGMSEIKCREIELSYVVIERERRGKRRILGLSEDDLRFVYLRFHRNFSRCLNSRLKLAFDIYRSFDECGVLIVGCVPCRRCLLCEGSAA